MRPMISSRENRADMTVFDSLPRPDYTESRFHHDCGIQAEDIWAFNAVREARVMLAESEPASGDTMAHTWKPGSVFAPVWGIRRNAEGDALVSSLSAFLSAPDPAEYLRSKQ